MQGQPVEVQSYQTPWKALSEFALQGDMDQPHAPFQQLVSNYNILCNMNPSSHSAGWHGGSGGGEVWDGSRDHHGRTAGNIGQFKAGDFDSLKNHADTMEKFSPHPLSNSNFAKEKLDAYIPQVPQNPVGYSVSADAEYNHTSFQYSHMPRPTHRLNEYQSPVDLSSHRLHKPLSSPLSGLDAAENDSFNMMEEEDDAVVYLEDL